MKEEEKILSLDQESIVIYITKRFVRERLIKRKGNKFLPSLRDVGYE